MVRHDHDIEVAGFTSFFAICVYVLIEH